MKKYNTSSSSTTRLTDTSNRQKSSQYLPFCGERSQSNQQEPDYLSSNKEPYQIDKYSDLCNTDAKQVDSLTNNEYYLNDWESKLNLTCYHELDRHTKETDTMTPCSFTSNEEPRNIVNRVHQFLFYFPYNSLLRLRSARYVNSLPY